jgi:3-dehydroquinate dehydratase / shikimate dehydrogenase
MRAMRLCVVLTDLSDESLRAARKADLVELRLDHIGHGRVEELARGEFRSGIFTLRRRDQGGQCDLPEKERLNVLARACELGVGHVDIEWGSHDAFKRPASSRTKVILSYHNFEETPAGLADLQTRMEAARPDIVKIATAAKSVLDCLRLYGLLRSARIDTIALAMGAAGESSRAIGPVLGSYLTYCAAREGAGSAPGQWTVDRMKEQYGSAGPGAAVYGVAANPVSHSLSPAMLGAAFRAAGLDAVYVPFLVTCDPADFLRGYRDIVSGLSVTIPHKEKIMPALDRIDPLAKRIGAVNTVYKRDGLLCGTNTDALGAMSALAAAGVDIDADTRAAVLGAGGAARSIVAALRERGARVAVLNRTLGRAKALAEEFGCQAGGLEEVTRISCDLLINCTSVGMWPNIEATPIPETAIPENAVVFDEVYVPFTTRFLAAAERRGCRVVRGLDMFVAQGAEQFRIWTGREPPTALMRSTVAGILEARMSNG